MPKSTEEITGFSIAYSLNYFHFQLLYFLETRDVSVWTLCASCGMHIGGTLVEGPPHTLQSLKTKNLAQALICHPSPKPTFLLARVFPTSLKNHSKTR